MGGTQTTTSLLLNQSLDEVATNNLEAGAGVGKNAITRATYLPSFLGE